MRRVRLVALSTDPEKAAVLSERAAEARREQDLDTRYIMLGAGDYLRKAADVQIDPPLENPRSTQTSAGEDDT